MKQSKISSLRWMFQTPGRSKIWVYLLTLIRVLQASTAFVYAKVLQTVVDMAVSGNSGGFQQTFILFACVTAASLVFLVCARYLVEKATAEMERAYRRHVFSQLLHRDFETVDGTHSGDWLTRIDSDVSVIVTGIVRILPDLTGHTLRVALVLYFLLDTIAPVVYIIVPVGLLLGFGGLFFRKRMKQLHRFVQQAIAKMRSTVQERLTSLGVIHAFTQEDSTVSQVDGELGAVAKAKMRRSIFINLCNSSISFGLFSAQVAGIGLCCYSILQGNMSYGTMSAVLYLINQLEGPLVNISSYISQAFAMLASCERLQEIEALKPDSDVQPVSEEAARAFYNTRFAALELQDANFAYRDAPDKPVVQGLHLEVKKGEFICFTGESGCGKSTTMKLLLQLYHLHSGQCRLVANDGTRQELHAGWRSLFAYVPQGNHLFSGTLRETIAFGDPQRMAQEEEIWKVLEIACADGFVRELPNGLDTLLGEKGSGLSEGQMQRIAIARAILSQRPILLLDECTSALDPETEYALLRNLRAMTNHTVLTITHRPAVLEFCDRQIPFCSNPNDA